MALADGLVGYWCPWLGSSGYRLLDRARSNHGTLTNMDAGTDWVGATVRGRSGRVLDFDGSNDYVPLTPFNLKTYCPTVGCILIWVYPRSSSRNAYLADWNTAGSNETFRVEMSGYQITQGRIGGTFLATGDNVWLETSATVSLNTWHLVAIQRTSSGQELFWNGVLDGSNSALLTNFPADANPIVLGRGGSFNGLYSNAQVAEVALWNRSLTRSEHLELYRLGPGWYQPYRKRGYGYAAAVAGFKAYWHRRETQLIGGGLR